MKELEQFYFTTESVIMKRWRV